MLSRCLCVCGGLSYPSLFPRQGRFFWCSSHCLDKYPLSSDNAFGARVGVHQMEQRTGNEFAHVVTGGTVSIVMGILKNGVVSLILPTRYRNIQEKAPPMPFRYFIVSLQLPWQQQLSKVFWYWLNVPPIKMTEELPSRFLSVQAHLW